MPTLCNYVELCKEYFRKFWGCAPVTEISSYCDAPVSHPC